MNGQMLETGTAGSRSGSAIPASIEVTPKQALESADLPGLFPADTRVYVADLGNTDDRTLTSAARRLAELGYRPVPHLAARRLTTLAALEARIASLCGEAGASDLLIVGGGLSRPAGEFDSTMAVLETGLPDRYGIRQVGIAGHPEGSTDFSEEVANQALRLKQAYGERTDAQIRIVTQFGFNPEKSIQWVAALAQSGVDMPVHLGVAGPAKLTTLIKYAAMCGVGNSIEFLRKRALSLSALATNQSPETIVGPIEAHWRADASTAIEQMHVFPFGGIQRAAEWLKARGSWT